MDDIDSYLSLWAAVLQRAVDDARISRPPDSEERMSIEWIRSERVEPRSFLWVCDMLSIEPQRVRAVCHIEGVK